ncbi:hypothetical protein ACR78Z_12790 [Sphingobacterium thalpophilum]|uniref:hypothetical protein n=1 Tax=Sphingobacterium thalpophilum TaxID=259 RepID=UPI003DA6B3AB
MTKEDSSSFASLRDIMCDDTKVSFYIHQGISQFNRKDIDKALSFYDAGLKRFRHQGMLHYLKANAYFVVKEHKLAMYNYLRAFDSIPDVYSYMRVRQQLTEPEYKDMEMLTYLEINLKIAETAIEAGELEIAAHPIHHCLPLLAEDPALAPIRKQFVDLKARLEKSRQQ